MSGGRKLGVILLCIILFICLSAIGIFYTANSTVLNKDFVNEQITNLDITAIVDEAIQDEVESGDIPQEVKDIVYSVTSNINTYIETEITALINESYDYIKGETSQIDIVALARDAAPSPQFIEDVLDDIDGADAFEAYIEDEIGEITLSEYDFLKEQISAAAVLTLNDYETQIKAIIVSLVDPIEDYIFGITGSINEVINLEGINNAFLNHLEDEIIASPPPQYASLSPVELSAALSVMRADISAELPSEIIINEETLDMSATDIKLEFDDAQETIEGAREVVKYFYTGFGGTIAFTLLIIVLMVFIMQSAVYSTLVLGITFFAFGVFEYPGLMVARNTINDLTITDAPQAVQTWLADAFNAATDPFLTLILGCIIFGVLLVSLSFVLKSRENKQHLP